MKINQIASYILIITIACNIVICTKTSCNQKIFYIQPSDSNNTYAIKKKYVHNSTTLSNITNSYTHNDTTTIHVNIPEKILKNYIIPALTRPKNYYLPSHIKKIQTLVAIILAADYLGMNRLLDNSLKRLPLALNKSLKKTVSKTVAALQELPEKLIYKSIIEIDLKDDPYGSSSNLLNPITIEFTRICYSNNNSHSLETLFLSPYLKSYIPHPTKEIITKHINFTEFSPEQLILIAAVQNRRGFTFNRYPELVYTYNQLTLQQQNILDELIQLNKKN